MLNTNQKKKLGFGLMRLPVLDERDRSTINIAEVERMVDLYMLRGFCYFDTAHRYNDEMSEVVLRKTLTERYPRNSYWLTDKLTFNYIHDKSDQLLFIQNQLKICGVSEFDLYLIHNLGEKFYPYAEKYETFDFMKDVKRMGLAKHIGFSYHGSPELLENILLAHPEMEYVQLQINYLDWEDPIIQSRRCYEIVRKYERKILVMEPVKGGTLMNLPTEAAELLRQSDPTASYASWAIKFAAGLPGVEVVLSGMSTYEQIKDNTEYMHDFTPLANSELNILKKAAEVIRKDTAIACTNCRYCVTECPQRIPIPDYFALYNNMKRLKNTSYLINQRTYYANISNGQGRASDCIKCGLCEKNCPQQLKIRENLTLIAAAFE